MIHGLDPRSAPLRPPFVPLAPRPAPEHSRFVIIRSMPPGSGVGAVAEVIASELRRRFPNAHVDVMLREQVLDDDPAERASIAADYDYALYVAGPTATAIALGLGYAGALEAAGTPCSIVCFDSVAQTIPSAMEAVGAPVRISIVETPPRSDEQTSAAAIEAVNTAIAELAPEETQQDNLDKTPRPRVFATGSEDELQDTYYRAGFTDGLPIILPTEERLAQMLKGTSRAPDEIVTTTIRPLGRPLTVETVAINAVMAGATPVTLPFILAASSIMGDQTFESMTRSVNAFAFAQEVSGPLAVAAGFDGGVGALSPNARTNGTAGRALGLVVRNGGGAQIGTTSTPTIGAATAWSLVLTENPASPWPRRDLGFGPAQTTLSILLGGMSHAGSFYYGDLDDVARHLNTYEAPALGAVVLLSLKRARTLSEERGMSRNDVEDYLQERCTTTLGELRASGFWHTMKADIQSGRPGPFSGPKSYLTDPDDTIIPRFAPGRIQVLVVGDDSSNVMQVWSLQRYRTVAVDDWA